MRTATTKVRRETYDLFRKLCQKQGETPYSVLRNFVLAFVGHFGGGRDLNAQDLGGIDLDGQDLGGGGS